LVQFVKLLVVCVFKTCSAWHW